MAERPSFSVFIATSVDGYIARRDGSLDWLMGATPESPPSDTDLGDFGFGAFFASVDLLLMGRSTYDTVIGFGEWPYGNTPVVVVTHRALDPPTAAPDAPVTAAAGTPSELVAQLAASGHRHVYVDGGDLIQQFLAAGLIDRLTISRVPVLLGDGISLFGSVPADVHLHHDRTESWSNGLVQTTYSVVH